MTKTKKYLCEVFLHWSSFQTTTSKQKAREIIEKEFKEKYRIELAKKDLNITLK